MILVWQDNGDDTWPAEMHARGFDHLALHAEYMDDGCPVATAREFIRYQSALGANDRNGEYYPDGIAELIPHRNCAVLVYVLASDWNWIWASDGERNADGDPLYRLDKMGDWTVYPAEDASSSSESEANEMIINARTVFPVGTPVFDVDTTDGWDAYRLGTVTEVTDDAVTVRWADGDTETFSTDESKSGRHWSSIAHDTEDEDTVAEAYRRRGETGLGER